MHCLLEGIGSHQENVTVTNITKDDELQMDWTPVVRCILETATSISRGVSSPGGKIYSFRGDHYWRQNKKVHPVVRITVQFKHMNMDLSVLPETNLHLMWRISTLYIFRFYMRFVTRPWNPQRGVPELYSAGDRSVLSWVYWWILSVDICIKELSNLQTR